MFSLNHHYWWLFIFSTLFLKVISYKYINVEPEFQKSRFKSLQCFTDNSSLISFRYCRVKFSRNSSALAINLTFHRRITRPLNIRLAMSYKYGTIYREVIKVPEFELCGVLKNFNFLPPMIKALFDVLGDSIAAILKGCPYSGDIDLLMIADVSKFPSIFPSGMYKTEAWATTTNTKIMNYIVQIEIVSNIKTSF